MKFADPKRPTLAECEKLMAEYDGSLDLESTPITALPERLTVGGYLDLRDTPITALPKGLTVGGLIYLEGTPIPIIYTDERGYGLRRVMCGDAEWWVAGCRLFTSRADALAHWGADNYPDRARGDAFCAAINATEEM